MPNYIPGGYEDSDEPDSDDDFFSSRYNNIDVQKEKEIPEAKKGESWLEGRLKKRAESGNGKGPPDEYDTDLREILDTGDLDLLDQLVTGAGLSVNHSLISHNGWSLALYAAGRADHHVLSWLVERGGQLESKGDEPCSGFQALSSIQPQAASQEDLLLTAQIILETGEDVNAMQSQLKTPLMLAASNGHYGLVEFLCQNGANLDQKDSQGWTALMFGTDTQHGQVVRFLLEAGSDPNPVSGEGQTAADLAAEQGCDALQRIIEGYSRMKGIHVERSLVQQRKQTELDGILIGLDADQYKVVFEEHSIGLPEFLLLNEADLEKLGVTEVGTRKRLLAGQHNIHLRPWDKSSMPAIDIENMQTNLRLSCVEAAAMLGNISTHLTYLKANVGFLRQQAREFGPRLMLAGSSVTDSSQLLNILSTTRQRIQGLNAECNLLTSELVLLGAGPTVVVPPDSLFSQTKSKSCYIRNVAIVAAMSLLGMALKKFFW